VTIQEIIAQVGSLTSRFERLEWNGRAQVYVNMGDLLDAFDGTKRALSVWDIKADDWVLSHEAESIRETAKALKKMSPGARRLALKGAQ